MRLGLQQMVIVDEVNSINHLNYHQAKILELLDEFKQKTINKRAGDVA
jgi:hypothetical protein